MSRRINVNPNDLCPCWSGKKFKRCCRDVTDWEQILRSGQDYRDLMSVRGRNILFAAAISDALGIDPSAEISRHLTKKLLHPQPCEKFMNPLWKFGRPIQTSNRCWSAQGPMCLVSSLVIITPTIFHERSFGIQSMPTKLS